MKKLFRTLRIRLALIFGCSSLVLGFCVTIYINQLASEQMTNDCREELQTLSKTIALALRSNLEEREREVLLLSRTALFTRGDLNNGEIRNTLEIFKRSYPHYAWIGVADTEGTVRTAADGEYVGGDVSKRDWFIRGRNGAYTGEVYQTVAPAKMPKVETLGKTQRFVDFAVPVRDAAGRLRGVLATHAQWSWIDELIKSCLPKDASRDSIEVFVVGRNGDIIYPYQQIGQLQLPSNIPSENTPVVIPWGVSGRFMVSSIAVSAGSQSNTGWHVLVREPIAKALAPVTKLHETLFVFGMLASCIWMFLAYRVAIAFSRPVEQLAAVAKSIAQGDEDAVFPSQSGIHEIRGLTSSLHEMTTKLLESKRNLEQHNEILEQSVQQRTVDLVTANRALERLAHHDALTGLHNRLAANERLLAEFSRMKRSGVPYAVLLMDIDHFKRVNDSFGHEAGDKVLKQIAQVLQGAVRQSDFVARFGGEEFLALLPETSGHNAVLVAEKVRRAVAEADMPGVGQVTLSIGVAEANSSSPGKDDAVREADLALYRAKDAGRNRVALSPAIDAISLSCGGRRG